MVGVALVMAWGPSMSGVSTCMVHRFLHSAQTGKEKQQEAGYAILASSSSSSRKRLEERPGPHVRGAGRVPGPEGDARSLARLRGAAALLAGAPGLLVEPAQQPRPHRRSDQGFEEEGTGQEDTSKQGMRVYVVADKGV